MKTVNVPCNNCGASLKLAANTKFLSCNYCGSSLKVIRSSGSTFTEVLEGIDEKTTQIAQDTRIIRIQNDLELLDREWEKKRKSLMVLNSNDKRIVPNELDVQMGAFFSFFSLLVSGILAYNLEFPPIFGIGFLLAIILLAYSVNHNSKLAKYRHAAEEYQQARNALIKSLNEARKA